MVPSEQSRTWGGDDEIDSDLGSDMISDTFNVNSFFGGGVYGSIDLGLQLPKAVVVRVWNDKNLNGIQDKDELGIPNVQLQLVEDKTRANLFDHGGNSHEVATADEFGRAVFTSVPMGPRYRVKTTGKPDEAAVTMRNAGSDNYLDSDMNISGISDSFKLPIGASEIFDKVDVGYYFPENAAAYVEERSSFTVPEYVTGVEDSKIPALLKATVDIDPGLEEVVGPFRAYLEVIAPDDISVTIWGAKEPRLTSRMVNVLVWRLNWPASFKSKPAPILVGHSRWLLV